MTIINYFLSIRDKNDKEDEDTISLVMDVCVIGAILYISDQSVFTF
jgi:hypothetical protein